MKIFLWLLFSLVSIPAMGAIVFDLKSQPALDEVPTGTLRVGRVTATFSGFGGNLNSNAGQFGINGFGGADDADAIEGPEGLDISFDRHVTLEQLDLQDFNSGESADVVIGMNPAVTLSDPSDNAFDVFDFTDNHLIRAGELLTLFSTAGDFGISTFSVNVAAIPESTDTFLFFLAVMGVAFVLLRRKQARTSRVR